MLATRKEPGQQLSQRLEHAPGQIPKFGGGEACRLKEIALNLVINDWTGLAQLHADLAPIAGCQIDGSELVVAQHVQMNEGILALADVSDAIGGVSDLVVVDGDNLVSHHYPAL